MSAEMNTNEYFMKPEEQNNEVNQNLINTKDLTDQYFIKPEKSAIKSLTIPTEFCMANVRFWRIFLLVVIILGAGVAHIFWALIVLEGILFILFLYLCCYKSFKRLEVTKDEINQTILIKTINCFNCVSEQLNLSNIHFHIGTIYDDRENHHVFYRLFIMKDFNNSPEIDLDSSNVKQIPLKLYDYIDRIWPDKECQKQLNELEGTPDYKCPFKFDIKEYMHIEPSEQEKQFQNLFQNNPIFNNFSSYNSNYSQYLKFCDNFFCYYIEEPFGEKKADILRIDFIYSKTFDRIFIGLVNNNKKTYKKTFEFNMETIDKFVLQEIALSNGYNLMALFKDNSNQQIYSLKNAKQDNLRGLVYLLNERINNSINNKENITIGNAPPIVTNE